MGAEILTILADLGVETGCFAVWGVKWFVVMVEGACECWLMRQD